jgi:type II secretion system protein N
MNPFKGRPWIFITLIFYTLFLTAALLYIRFPAEQFKVFCQTKLEQVFPETSCTINNLRFKYPFSLEAEEINITEDQGKKERIASISLATISPKLRNPTALFHVDIKAYGGKHTFSLLLNKEDQLASLDNIEIKDMDLSRITFLHTILKRKITGLLSGKGSYHATWKDDDYKAEGQGDIIIEDGSFSLLLPVLSLKEIDLKSSKANISLRNNALQFEKGAFQGRELNGDFSGKVAFQYPLQFSKLVFKGSLSPLPPLLKKSRYAKNMVHQLKRRHNRTTLPFLLQGNLARPRFKFDS